MRDRRSEQAGSPQLKPGNIVAYSMRTCLPPGTVPIRSMRISSPQAQGGRSSGAEKTRHHSCRCELRRVQRCAEDADRCGVVKAQGLGLRRKRARLKQQRPCMRPGSEAAHSARPLKLFSELFRRSQTPEAITQYPIPLLRPSASSTSSICQHFLLL